MPVPSVSVISPVYRDVAPLSALLRQLPDSPQVEVIVAAAQEELEEVRNAAQVRPGTTVVAGPRGRARQMNAGAAAARGEWLLFLHADSRPGEGWVEAICAADRDGPIGIGCFRFALDSRDWRARVIEFGNARRVAWLGLPYGDQGLFLRRETFERLGGYRPLPLMEDADLVRRARRIGPLRVLSVPMITSARRWEREGWWCRTAWNYLLAGVWLAGGSPAWIARRYAGRRPAVVGLMTRDPESGGKTRLWEALGRRPDAALGRALLQDTAGALRTGPADLIVLVDPPESAPALRVLPDLEVLAQRGGSLGERMQSAFEDLFALGYRDAILVGSDVPTIRTADIRRACRALRRGVVVLGPADDGGYYLIGLRTVVPTLFTGIAWGSPDVLRQTEAAAARAGLEVVRLAPRYDVDTPADLDRLMTEPAEVAPRTRTWWRDLRDCSQLDCTRVPRTEGSADYANDTDFRSG